MSLDCNGGFFTLIWYGNWNINLLANLVGTESNCENSRIVALTSKAYRIVITLTNGKLEISGYKFKNGFWSKYALSLQEKNPYSLDTFKTDETLYDYLESCMLKTFPASPELYSLEFPTVLQVKELLQYCSTVADLTKYHVKFMYVEIQKDSEWDGAVGITVDIGWVVIPFTVQDTGEVLLQEYLKYSQGFQVYLIIGGNTMRFKIKKTMLVDQTKQQARLCVAAAVVAGLIVGASGFAIFVKTQGSPFGTSEKHELEQKMSTDGKWEKFNDYGISLRMPKDPPEEDVGEEYSKYEKRCVQRDDGNFPELCVGTIIIPDEDAYGRTYDETADISGIVDVVRPYLNDAIARMFNGVYPAITADIGTIELDNGITVIEGSGEVNVTVVYQDPKNPDEPYAEETPTNLYYLVRIFHNRPIVAWGTWDYSTYQGDETVQAYVKDAILSLTSIEGKDISDPLAEYEKDVSSDIEDESTGEVVNSEDLDTSTWDKDKQQWVNDKTGEVVDLPAPDDSYWDDRKADNDVAN